MRHLGEEIATQVARAPRPLVAVASAGSSIGTKLAGPRPSFRRAHQLMRVSRTRPDRRWLSLHEQNLPISYPQLLGPVGIAARVRADAERDALGYYRRCASADHLNRLLYAELKFQLPPNDLMKVDRTFMYNGVAGRSPLLDRRVVEFAASLPACWKRHGRTYKWFLRQVAADRIPPELVSAPKVGLAVPLRDMAARRARRTCRRRRLLQQFSESRHLQTRSRPCGGRGSSSGRRDYGYAIWTMAMVELWYRTFIDSFAEPSVESWA